FRIAGGGHPVFEGMGARIHGGRWNSSGRAVIYCGGSFAIAMLERLVYAGIGRTPTNDRYVEITVPADLVEELDPAALPGWDETASSAARAFGDRWYDENRSAALAVPSAVTKIDRNVVLNQRHPAFGRIGCSDE